MSVYRDTNASVVFEHPYPGPLTAAVYRDGDTTPILTVIDIASTAGRFELELSYEVTSYDGPLRVEWYNGDAGFRRIQYVNVVTPLVSLSRLAPLFEGEFKTNSELQELETTVRVFIEAYCGQKFGYRFGTKTVTTVRGKALLDERAANLTTVTGGTGSTLRIGLDGYSLIAIPSTTTYPSSAEEVADLIDAYDHIIYAPSAGVRIVRDATYVVTGEWGWDTVPQEVQEAAMLLANDFSCNEVLYRDRYLESVKIQQDTITYHPGAFRGTGNARADLLLGKFRRSGMVII